jgi:hypothetical protein
MVNGLVEERVSGVTSAGDDFDFKDCRPLLSRMEEYPREAFRHPAGCNHEAAAATENVSIRQDQIGPK